MTHIEHYMALCVLVLLLSPTVSADAYDLIVADGTVYDGSGQPPILADIGITGAHITAIGNLSKASAKRRIDATGLAVSPGFINMLSWADESLLQNGIGQSDLRQGITLEVFGEGRSKGPLTEAMQQQLVESKPQIPFPARWASLDDYLTALTKRGVAINVASFVGASTIRAHVLGYDNVQPTPKQLQTMQTLVEEAMQDGATGLSSALLYPPGAYAKLPELIALAKSAARHNGLYVSVVSQFEIPHS